MSKKQDLKQIGGWLLFFIITLIVISPLFNLYLLFSDFFIYSFLEVIEVLASISLFILAGIFLWTKKPYAVQFTKIFLIANVIIVLFVSVLTNDYTLVSNTIIYTLIWVLYLYNSERVKTIYGNLKEKKKDFKIWPILSIIYAIISPIFGIIFSIMSLRKISKNRKLKGISLSIIALVIGVVLFFIYFVYGMFAGAGFDYVPEDIEISCSDYCYYIDEATFYYLEYDLKEEGYFCYCLDDSSNIVEEKIYHYNLE